MRSERASQLRAELAALRTKPDLTIADITRVDEISTEIATEIVDRSRRSQLDALGVPNLVDGGTVSPRTLGDAVISSPEYKSVSMAIAEAATPRFSHWIEMKAPGDPVLEGTGDNNTAIAPTWYGLETPGLVQFPLRLVDVLNVVQLTTGNSANYPKVVTQSITDMTDTAESENKAGAEFGFDFVTETLKKWTAFGGASEEMFQDAPTLTNYINTELGVMARQKEERYIAQTLYTGSTTAADGSGIGGAAGYDAILEAITMVRVAGGTPNAVLIHPYDFARLAATQGSGVGYFSGGPYAALRENLWGAVREIQTTAVPEGTALVGDFQRGARLFRKGGARVEMSNSHDDWFRKNLVAIRAEIRSVLGVTYPEFFVEVFIGS